MDQHRECAFCHSILFDDDDIVYCPVCGEPHHRKCYEQLGRCANEENHGAIQEQESENPETENKPFENDNVTVCPNCGRQNAEDAVFCSYCGMPLKGNGDAAQYGYGAPPFQSVPFSPAIDPYGGVDSNDDLGDGVSANEAALFLRSNTRRYIPVFKKFKPDGGGKKKRAGWNWSAFVFSTLWMLYRKCYTAFIAFFILMVAFLTMMAPAYSQFYTLISSYISDGSSYSYAEMQQIVMSNSDAIMTAIAPWKWLLMMIGMLLIVLLHVAAGLLGDYILRCRTINTVRAIKEDDGIDDKHFEIQRKGGVAMFLPIIYFYFFQYISQLILMSF